MRYEVLPPTEKIRFALISIDLAISKKSSADKTAIVAAYVSNYGKKLKTYIAPIIINKRLGFTETIQEIKKFQNQLIPGIPKHLLVENVGYQQSAIEQLKLEGFYVDPSSPQGDDKIARQSAIAPLVKNGTILFPIEGLKELEQQLVGLGIEAHDDLADAFAYLAKGVQEEMTKPEFDYAFV